MCRRPGPIGPFGVESGKYVTSPFYAKADSTISKVESAPDIAGKRVIVGLGANQEAILLRWDAGNKKNGLKPVEFQYFDDDSASQLALQSGRADLTFGPNATASFKAPGSLVCSSFWWLIIGWLVDLLPAPIVCLSDRPGALLLNPYRVRFSTLAAAAPAVVPCFEGTGGWDTAPAWISIPAPMPRTRQSGLAS